ncbi:minor capsid protein [Neobacillus sp. 19]|uniref:minor capsid protein n=1 Tax=Neobacillus sp. 19 TaxID=3394458 RepID=UPI003BF61EEE
MKILDLTSFIKSRVDGVYYPNSFPISKTTPDACAVVKLTGGFPPSQWTGKKQPSFQIRVRGKANDPAEVETRAYALNKSLMNLRDVIIGEDSVVIIRAMHSEPFYIGNDDNNRPIYSMNFDCVVRPNG